MTNKALVEITENIKLGLSSKCRIDLYSRTKIFCLKCRIRSFIEDTEIDL